MSSNGFKIAARISKRDALVEKLDRIVSMCGLDPHRDSYLVVGVIREWTDARWAELAVAAGKNPPSEVTRGMVVDALLARGRKAG